MIPHLVAEGLRLHGEANARLRTACLLERREVQWNHPLAAAHRRVGMDLGVIARRMIEDGMWDGGLVFLPSDPRTPEDWRREGRRAARCFQLGLAFAAHLESRVPGRRNSSYLETEADVLYAEDAGGRAGAVA